MDDQATIGARLRTLRKWRGMTLKELGGLAGVSYSYLSQIENGKLALDRRSYISAIAAALRVSETDIVGGPHLGKDPVQSGPHAAIPAMRVALQTNRLGQAIVDQARPLEDLVEAVRRIEPLKRALDYTQMGAALPDLLDELHYQVTNPADEAAQRDALTALVDACYYVGVIAKNLNYADLAWSASERGLAAAEMLDDPVIIGKAMFPVVLNLPREGGWRRIQSIAEGAVETLEPQIGAHAEGVEVLGMTTLNAALAAAAVNDHARARDWLSEAHALAARIPDEPTRTWLHFSATNVAVWDITVRVESGESGGAILELAEQVKEPKLAALPNRLAGFLSDTGRGLARDPKTRPAALDCLRRAESAAPQHVRNNVRVHETVAVMVQQAKNAAVGVELRGMAARMGIPH